LAPYRQKPRDPRKRARLGTDEPSGPKRPPAGEKVLSGGNRTVAKTRPKRKTTTDARMGKKKTVCEAEFKASHSERKKSQKKKLLVLGRGEEEKSR